MAGWGVGRHHGEGRLHGQPASNVNIKNLAPSRDAAGAPQDGGRRDGKPREEAMGGAEEGRPKLRARAFSTSREFQRSTGKRRGGEGPLSPSVLARKDEAVSDKPAAHVQACKLTSGEV